MNPINVTLVVHEHLLIDLAVHRVLITQSPVIWNQQHLKNSMSNYANSNKLSLLNNFFSAVTRDRPNNLQKIY